MLAIAAGIVEGMNLGNNSMAALVSQGCSEIRWLATKVLLIVLSTVVVQVRRILGHVCYQITLSWKFGQQLERRAIYLLNSTLTE